MIESSCSAPPQQRITRLPVPVEGAHDTRLRPAGVGDRTVDLDGYRATARPRVDQERACNLGVVHADAPHDARTDFAELTLVRYPHEPLNDRVWELRENLTAYDATFVALAEALDVPLITCDTRLAATPGSRARIEVYDNSR